MGTQMPAEVLSLMMERSREMGLSLGLRGEGPMTYLLWEKVYREPLPFQQGGKPSTKWK